MSAIRSLVPTASVGKAGSVVTHFLFLLCCGPLAAADYTFQFQAERVWDFSGEYRITDTESDQTSFIIHSPDGAVHGTYARTITNETIGVSAFGLFSGQAKSSLGRGVMTVSMSLVVDRTRFEDGKTFHSESILNGDYRMEDGFLVAGLIGRVCKVQGRRVNCGSSHPASMAFCTWLVNE